MDFLQKFKCSIEKNSILQSERVLLVLALKSAFPAFCHYSGLPHSILFEIVYVKLSLQIHRNCI